MRVIRRIAVLLIELPVEALLLGVLFSALAAEQNNLLSIALAGIMVVPVILFLYGYYVSRTLAAIITLRSPVKWHYPALVSIAFIAHVSYIGHQFWPDVTPQAHNVFPSFLLGGACIVFAVSFAGSLWSMTSSPQLGVCEQPSGWLNKNE